MSIFCETYIALLRQITELLNRIKKIGPDRNPARIKIQYPMKNRGINAGSQLKLQEILINFFTYSNYEDQILPMENENDPRLAANVNRPVIAFWYNANKKWLQ